MAKILIKGGMIRSIRTVNKKDGSGKFWELMLIDGASDLKVTSYDFDVEAVPVMLPVDVLLDVKTKIKGYDVSITLDALPVIAKPGEGPVIAGPGVS